MQGAVKLTRSKEIALYVQITDRECDRQAGKGACGSVVEVALMEYEDCCVQA